MARHAEAGGQLTALIAKVSKMRGVQSHTFWTFGVVRSVLLHCEEEMNLQVQRQSTG